jgi:NADH-quinone oxidoreductase subunit E
MSAEIESIMKKYRPGRREDLIPLLQEIQDENGYLSEDIIVKAGNFIGLSTTKIYGLATFYDQFRFLPAGRIIIRICNGTSCFLNGSQNVISKIREETGLAPGQTSRDGLFSYEIVTCMGGCTRGPLLTVNDDYQLNVKPGQIPDLLRKLRYIAEND